MTQPPKWSTAVISLWPTYVYHGNFYTGSTPRVQQINDENKLLNVSIYLCPDTKVYFLARSVSMYLKKIAIDNNY